MRTKSDIAAELIYSALTAGKAVSFDDCLEYLDFYADLRAVEMVPAAPDQATAPLLELNDRNEYETADEGSAEDIDDEVEADAEQKKTPGDEHIFTGRGAAEKRAIHSRLIEYRQAHGIGCFNELAALAYGVSADEIRGMHGAAPMPLPKWLAVGRALDVLKGVDQECRTTTNAPTAECSSTPESSATAEKMPS